MPLPSLSETEGYSKWTGFIYIFNLIVGTGALALPHSFSEAGWLLSLLAIIALAFMSYVTVTFVIEAMATTNAIRHWQRIQSTRASEIQLDNSSRSSRRNSDTEEISQFQRESEDDELNHQTAGEYSPLLENSVPHRLPMPMDYYSITEKIELGEMMKVYFKRGGIIMFYICICVYLYGDLAIYATAVAKTLRDVSCTYNVSSIVNASNASNVVRCWEGVALSRSNAYRIYVVCFLTLLGPFVFFNVQKTKYLQIFTTIFRWAAFTCMVVLAINKLASHGREGHPSLASFKNLPELFGACVYSFMCHHSLPSLVTPISDKRKISSLFAADYFLILCFYILLSFTGIFAFKSVEDLYTLNFKPEQSDSTGLIVLEYFLSLFPVFTLSTNFPIIGITLRNNLQALLLNENSNVLAGRVLLPLLAIIPPVLVSLASEDVGFLMSITGTYSGTGIQYVIPTMLVYRSRMLAKERFGPGIHNRHMSVFRHRGWLVFVLVWAATCVVLVTINNIIQLTS